MVHREANYCWGLFGSSMYWWNGFYFFILWERIHSVMKSTGIPGSKSLKFLSRNLSHPTNMLSNIYDFLNSIFYRQPIDNWRLNSPIISLIDFAWWPSNAIRIFKSGIQPETQKNDRHFHFNKSKIILKCLKCRECHPIRYLVFASNQRKYAHLEKKWIIIS